MAWQPNIGSIFGNQGPSNAKASIAAQANAKRAAANKVSGPRSVKGVAYGGGPLTQDLNSFRPPSGGTMGTNQTVAPAPMGYEEGGFSDPNIDWQAIYDAMIAPSTYQTPAPPGGDSGGGGMGAGGGLAPTPSLFVPPESITAAPAVAQPPAVVAEAPPSAINVPGESFTSVGTPGSFGSYERKRQSRGPRTGMSVTPEMIRRAAANRLG